MGADYGTRERDMSHIGPRIPEHVRQRLSVLWKTANSGAEWILASFPNLYDRTLIEIKGHFSKGELDLILDLAELLVFFPEMAGQLLLFCLMDEMAVPTIKENHPAVDMDALLKKMQALRHFQRAMLETWAQAYQFIEGGTSRGEYIGMLT